MSIAQENLRKILEELGLTKEYITEVLRGELKAGLEFTVLPLANIVGLFVDKECNVYAGTHSGTPARVYKSVDGGFTWTEIFRDSDASRAMSIYVTEEGYILVGTVAPARLYVSFDGGKTWEKKLDRGKGYLRDIVEDRDGNLYASHSGTPDNPGAIFKSTDRGKTWIKVYVPVGEYSIEKMYYCPWRDAIYFHHGTGTTGRIGKTTNGFETVSDLPSPPFTGSFRGITSNQKYVFFTDDAAHWMLRTEDDETAEGILTRTSFPYSMRGPWSVAVSPLGNLYVGEYGGSGDGLSKVWISPDNGETWRVLFRLRGTLIHNIAFSPDGWVYCSLLSGDAVKDKPIRLTEGHTLMAKWRDIPMHLLEPEQSWIDKPFDNAEIRDTDPHYGWWRGLGDLRVISCMKGYSKATIAIHNGLDVDISVQVQGCYHRLFDDAPHPYERYVWDIGSSFTVSAGACQYETLTDHFPYIRVRVTASAVPSSGVVDVWVFKKR